MKKKNSKRSSRISPKKIHISKGAKGLTAQAGLIPVVRFLQKQSIISLIQGTVKHQRGATALYDVVDAIFLPLIAIVGGARSIAGIVTVWADSVLCRASGWISIPDETTFGRLLRTFKERHINELETLTHKIDGVVKSLHLLCYSVWPYVRHTTCMPSRMTKHYALYMKIFT